MVQVKFTIESDIVARFKSRCASENVSMASVICRWMKTVHPSKTVRETTDTRPHRRKAVKEIIAILEGLLHGEETYRDAIPEAFQARQESAEHTCGQIEQAIACLEEAFQ
jgi:hypothetical protein